jgi:K+-sensing histidine kinase KdpD
MKTEEQRINYLHNLNILDTDFDKNFDRITELLQIVFKAPIILISLVDENRQWFKSCIGLDIRETDREVSFCSNAIKENSKNDIYIVNDTLLNPLYINNYLVTGNPNIRFYAGRVITIDNYKLGTVCIIDKKPREISDIEKKILKLCGYFVESEINKMNFIKKLKQNENNMKHISSIISHDLINTISPIISLAGLIKEYPEEFNLDYIDIIHQHSTNAINLSRDLLDNYKIDLQNLILNKKKISLTNFISKYNIKPVNIEINTNNKYIYIDSLRIDQVLTNLISNAKNFIDPINGKIYIKITEKSENFLFSVHDNGKGIPINKAHLLFQKFSENIYPDILRTTPRTGLGLYICKNLIELHNGKIWLEPSNVGSNFCFTIPKGELT